MAIGTNGRHVSGPTPNHFQSNTGGQAKPARWSTSTSACYQLAMNQSTPIAPAGITNFLRLL